MNTDSNVLYKNAAARALVAALATALAFAFLFFGAAETSQAKTVSKPARVTISEASSTSKCGIFIKVKKAKRAKYYQYKISTSKRFVKSKTKTKNTSKKTATFKKLEAGKKYYVKVRAYKKSGKRKIYGKWSKIKTVKVKKATSNLPSDSDAIPDGTDPGNGDAASKAELIAKVEKYTYKVTPVMAPFNNYFFVKTDNPDPESFRFVDKNSVYFESENTLTVANGDALVLCKTIFSDVTYTSEDKYRVSGLGYIFCNDNCCTDGGELSVEAKVSDGCTIDLGFGTIETDGVWSSTNAKATCAPVKSKVDWLISAYTSSNDTLFGNLNSVAAALAGLSIYPKSIKDASSTSGWGVLACSPYPERSLNEHIEVMNKTADKSLLLYMAYPLVLNSASYPSTIGDVAKKLNPNCSVKTGAYHYLVDVTLNGETRSFGGAGAGSTYPLYSKFFDNSLVYTFDGSAGDMSKSATLETMRAKLMEYYVASDEYSEELLLPLKKSEVAKVVGSGAWIRIAAEGSFGGHKGEYAYAAASYEEGDVIYASDAWVDGRYVCENEYAVDNATFEEHPYADIIIRNMTYPTIRYGTRTSDVVFRYDESSDSWRAPFYYIGDNWCMDSSVYDNLPDELVLTRSEVKELRTTIDCNSGIKPAHGYVYDGAAAPGTPF